MAAERPPWRSLRGEQPPVVRLASLVELELYPLWRVGLEVGEGDRCPLAADHCEDLGPSAEPRHRLRQRRPRPPPGHDLVSDEPDCVPLHETAIRVVAGGGCNRTGPDPA